MQPRRGEARTAGRADGILLLLSSGNIDSCWGREEEGERWQTDVSGSGGMAEIFALPRKAAFQDSQGQQSASCGKWSVPCGVLVSGRACAVSLYSKGTGRLDGDPT